MPSYIHLALRRNARAASRNYRLKEDKNKDDKDKEKTKSNFSKMFLIDELDKITQSTKFNEYSVNANINRIVYDKVFSGILKSWNSVLKFFLELEYKMSSFSK